MYAIYKHSEKYYFMSAYMHMYMSRYTHMYLYIYMCICICICTEREHKWESKWSEMFTTGESG